MPKDMALVFANADTSRYKDSGRDTVRVHTTMINDRDVRE